MRRAALLVSLLLLVALVSGGPPPGTVHAATITVAAGVVDIADDGQCSLSEAIENANDDAQTHDDCPAGNGADVIDIPAGTYHVFPSLPFLTGELTLRGAGQGETIIDGGGENHLPVFDPFRFSPIRVEPFTDSVVRFEDFTVTNGLAYQGGAISNPGNTVFLTRLTLTGNDSEFEAGGLWNAFGGTATVVDCIITDNRAEAGGGVFSGAETNITIRNSYIADNETSNASGVLDETPDGGGGVNTVPGVEGAIIDSIIVNNTTTGIGGGVDLLFSAGPIAGPMVRIINTTIAGNEAGITGGGINTVAGAQLEVINSTISGNRAPSGGGIFNHGVMALLNVTITGNGADDGLGGGMHTGVTGTTDFTNTLIANNAGGDCWITSLTVSGADGSNLDSDGSCPADLFDTASVGDIDLGPLADNGGASETHALGEGSAAIDVGNQAACDTIEGGGDQRGEPRSVDGDGQGGATCDIGAYEYQPQGGETPTAEPTDTPTPEPTETPEPTPTERGPYRNFAPLASKE